MKKCNVCKAELNIRLMPDFCSSGMWCGECGVSYANPKKNFPFISKGLIDLVLGWNELWDLCSTNSKQIGVEPFNILIRDMGKELAKQVSVYCNCCFDEESSKIYAIDK
jgi:hypothetical protein